MIADMTQEQTDERNRLHCKSIADELDKIAEGLIYRDEYGEEHDASDLDEIPDEWEPVSMWDYFEDIYNSRWVLGSNLEYFAVRLMVACGGPNVWVDTETQRVELYWWGDRASYPLSPGAVCAVDEYAQEWYESVMG